MVIFSREQLIEAGNSERQPPIFVEWDNLFGGAKRSGHPYLWVQALTGVTWEGSGFMGTESDVAACSLFLVAA